MKGAVPPNAVTVAEPSQLPPQNASEDTTDNTKVAGSVNVTEPITVQPLASSTLTPHVPSQRNEADMVVWAAGSFHKYVYGAVPPDTAAEPNPSHELLQLGFEKAGTTINGAGSPICTVTDVTQPLASVMLIIVVPAGKSTAVDDVSRGDVFQE